MNDDELKQHMRDLSKSTDPGEQKFVMDMMRDEIVRLRKQTDSLRMERDALKVIVDRLVEEICDIETKLPSNIARRWIAVIRGGWRV